MEGEIKSSVCICVMCCEGALGCMSLCGCCGKCVLLPFPGVCVYHCIMYASLVVLCRFVGPCMLYSTMFFNLKISKFLSLFTVL